MVENLNHVESSKDGIGETDRELKNLANEIKDKIKDKMKK
jgi:hypothetical protein